MNKIGIVAIMAGFVLLTCCGCWSKQEKGSELLYGNDPQRNTKLAERYNFEGLQKLRDGDYKMAEGSFLMATKADMFFAPAHNNLGLAYYHQKKFYQAAWEFQFAAKLMPGRAEPKNNLGLVYENVGKLEDAAKWYEQAVKDEPESDEPNANLARTYVRLNRKDDRTRQLLTRIVVKDARPEWSDWARKHLALIGPNSSPIVTSTMPTTMQ